MLNELASSDLYSNFIILADNLEAKGYDIFVAFVKKREKTNSVKTIKIICSENPPSFYMKHLKNCDKIEFHDFFSDPCCWNNESSTTISLNPFIGNSKNSEITYFIDSLTPLIEHNGFCSVYKNLFKLSKTGCKIVCLVHSDLLSETNLQELKFLSTSFISLQKLSKVDDNNLCDEKIVDIIYRKPGGKVSKETEIVLIDKNNFDIITRKKISKMTTKDVQNKEEDIENLTTFKLNLQLSENERRARSQLVLPYLRDARKNNEGGGQILYDIEADEMEDDPDDDLDI